LIPYPSEVHAAVRSSASIDKPDAILQPAKTTIDLAVNRVFTLQELDLKDTTILKGLSIIAIVLHNFFHVLGPTHQNEFTFQASRFPLFLHVVLHSSLAIQAFFTFLGISAFKYSSSCPHTVSQKVIGKINPVGEHSCGAESKNSIQQSD
jgi:hypothetical protein